jgi:hypothetical protein
MPYPPPLSVAIAASPSDAEAILALVLVDEPSGEETNAGGTVRACYGWTELARPLRSHGRLRRPED